MCTQSAHTSRFAGYGTVLESQHNIVCSRSANDQGQAAGKDMDRRQFTNIELRDEINSEMSPKGWNYLLVVTFMKTDNTYNTSILTMVLIPLTRINDTVSYLLSLLKNFSNICVGCCLTNFSRELFSLFSFHILCALMNWLPKIAPPLSMPIQCDFAALPSKRHDQIPHHTLESGFALWCALTNRMMQKVIMCQVQV
jgi:hypothetical protein